MHHISPTTIRAPTNLGTYLKDRLSQVSVQWGYCLFWMMHTTLSITQLYKSRIRANKTLLLRNYTTNTRAISHNDGDVCSYHHGTPFLQYIPRGIMVGALFCPICQILPVWFHYTMFSRLCCFRLTTVFENCHSDTLHNISRPKFAIVFQNGMCEIGFMTRFSQQRCRCFTVRWEFGLLNCVHVRWLRCQIKLSRVGILPLWNWSAYV